MTIRALCFMALFPGLDESNRRAFAELAHWHTAKDMERAGHNLMHEAIVPMGVRSEVAFSDDFPERES